MQHSLDAAINAPQRQADPDRSTFDILHASAWPGPDGSRTVEFRPKGNSWPATVTFAPDHSVAGVQVDTNLGKVTVAEQDVDAVLGRLDAELIFALREDTEPVAERRTGRESFTTRMSGILPAHLGKA